MKITLLGPAWPYRGGIAEFSNRLARQFSVENHEADLVTFTLQYPGFLFPGKTQYSESDAPPDLRIRRMVNSVNPWNWLSVGTILKKEKPDLLLLRFWLPFMGPALGTIARIVRSNHHTRVICVFDNVVPHEKRPGDRMLTSYFTKSIDGAIVLARAVGEDLKQFRKNIPVRYNPHPIFDNYGEPVSRDVALNTLKLPGENRYILFFGFIRNYKGLDLLLEAFANVKLRNKALKLIVAGEFYENPAPYHEMIRKYNLLDDVILYDRFIRDEEVPPLFGAADLIVQPYKSATQSGVTQVAFHFEKPMLVTDVGGLREIVPDKKCGYVVKPEPSEIAAAIDDFFINDRIGAFTQCVINEKEKFSWDRMTATVLDCYKDLDR